jgi:hypothetical protein
MNAPKIDRRTQTSHSAAPRSRYATFLLLGVAYCIATVPALAQNLPTTEKGFTIPFGTKTPIVMQVAPNATCQLHAPEDTTHSLKFNANGDGYFKIQVTPKQGTVEAEQTQIDCTSEGKVSTYLLNVRVGDTPTADMPAPQTVMPTPRGSKVLAALTEDDTRLASDSELLARGYPPRPDSTKAPDSYAKWLKAVARPITLLPSTSAVSGITHQSGIQEGLMGATNTHWSGMAATNAARTYAGIQASWNVPEIVSCDASGTNTASGFWIGLDGYPPSNDVEQTGTEQDCYPYYRYEYTAYYAWTEVYPAQPGNTEVMSVNSGDNMTAFVIIGDSNFDININGAYAWFFVLDNTTSQLSITHIALGSTSDSLTTAEWIMERPLNNSTDHLFLLSDYHQATMTDANVLVNGTWETAQTASTVQITMYNENWVDIDNNELSSAIFTGPESIEFTWHNYH